MAARVTIGDVEVLLFIDMVPPAYAPLEFFPDVTEEAWAPHRDDCLEGGELQLYYGCFALRSQGRVIMVDTGMGPGPHPSRGNRTGDLLNLLAKEGISPDDVDMVVHTHLHLDHVGWNVTWAEGTPRPTFPRARYLAPRADWDYFTQPDVMEKFPCIQESVTPLQSMGALELIEGEHSVTPQVTTLPAPGHTPGHAAVLITSRAKRASWSGTLCTAGSRSRSRSGAPGRTSTRTGAWRAGGPSWTEPSPKACWWRRGTSGPGTSSAAWSGSRAAGTGRPSSAPQGPRWLSNAAWPLSPRPSF